MVLVLQQHFDFNGINFLIHQFKCVFWGAQEKRYGKMAIDIDLIENLHVWWLHLMS